MERVQPLTKSEIQARMPKVWEYDPMGLFKPDVEAVLAMALIALLNRPLIVVPEWVIEGLDNTNAPEQ